MAVSRPSQASWPRIRQFQCYPTYSWIFNVGRWQNITTPNLALRQPIFASASRATFGPDLANDGVLLHSWCLPPQERVGWLEVDLTRLRSEPVDFNTLVLSEPVGRWDDYPRTRIGNYRFLALVGARWVDVVVMPGDSDKETRHVRIHRVQRVSATRVRLEIRGRETEPEPHVAEVGVYDEPDGGTLVSQSR